MRFLTGTGDAAVEVHRASSYSGSVEEMFGWLKTVALFRKTRHAAGGTSDGSSSSVCSSVSSEFPHPAGDACVRG
jgi:hypothetical protein